MSSNTNTISYNNIDTEDNGQHTCIVENTMRRSVGTLAYGNNSNHVVIEILSKIYIRCSIERFIWKL